MTSQVEIQEKIKSEVDKFVEKNLLGNGVKHELTACMGFVAQLNQRFNGHESRELTRKAHADSESSLIERGLGQDEINNLSARILGLEDMN